MTAKREMPAHWHTLAKVLEHREGHTVRLWFNAQLDGGFTAQVMDGRDAFAPPIEDGRVWSAYAKDPVTALNDLAYMVHKAINAGAR